MYNGALIGIWPEFALLKYAIVPEMMSSEIVQYFIQGMLSMFFSTCYLLFKLTSSNYC